MLSGDCSVYGDDPFNSLVFYFPHHLTSSDFLLNLTQHLAPLVIPYIDFAIANKPIPFHSLIL